MATRPIDTGMASALPLNLLAQAVPMLNRNELARLTERLIERLDEIDGEADTEDDDQDTCLLAEDQGTHGGRWFDTDGWSGDPDDEEDNGDREEVYY